MSVLWLIISFVGVTLLLLHDLKVILKSEVDFSKKSNFFSYMFYLIVGSMVNNKILLQHPIKKASHKHKFRLFYYTKTINNLITYKKKK